MMPTFFTTKFSLFVIAGLLLSFVILGAAEETRIHNWKVDFKAKEGELAQANIDLGTCRANVTTCRAALDRQNAAVKSGAQQAAKRQEEAAARAKKALRDEPSPQTKSGPEWMNYWFNHEFGVNP